MTGNLKKLIPVIFFLVVAGYFFLPFLAKGEIPLPADIVIGSYYPFKDEVWQGRTAGYPVKNFTIFDPVRQLYPWRFLAINQMKQGQLPLWNPHEFTGTPLLGNIFTAAFYPLNILFWIFDFAVSWGIMIAIQPFLAGLFTYWFLRNLKLTELSAVFGGIAFSYSSFMMTRLEWGITGHTVLWLPLILYSLDRFILEGKRNYLFVLTTSLAVSFLAGYFQGFLYLLFVGLAYALYRLWEAKDKNNKKSLFLLAISFMGSLLIVLPQAVSYGKLLYFSARGTVQHGIDSVVNYYLPPKHFLQLFVPDIFGSPATGNYWGTFNYTEFCSYLGVATLFGVIYALINDKRKDRYFWAGVLGVSFLFVFKNPISTLLVKFKIPLFSGLTPSRLIFPIDFSLAVLASFGLDSLGNENSTKNISAKVGKSIYLLFLFYLLVLVTIIGGFYLFPDSVWAQNIQVSLRNMVLPFIFLFFLTGLLKIYSFGGKKIKTTVLCLMILFLTVNLVRQGKKYNSFIPQELIFPSTELVDRLVSVNGLSRFQKKESEIFASNFQIMYGLNTIGGYDPFYPRRFVKMVFPEGDFELPDRDVFLGDHQSAILKMLGTRYVFSFEELKEADLRLIGEKGKTKLYEDTKAFSRAFLVDHVVVGKDDQEVLALLSRVDLGSTVVLEKEVLLSLGEGGDKTVEITDYLPNKVKIKVITGKERILVLSDTYYPGWQGYLDGNKVEIYRANYNIRAIVVPKGEHEIIFRYRPTELFVSGIISVFSILLILIMIICKLPLFKRKKV